MVRTVCKGRSTLGYLRLDCHDFWLILTKVAKLHFLERTLTRLNPDQNDIHRTIHLEITAL